MTRRLFGLLAVLLVSCETVPATQVVVFLDADAAVVARAESVEVAVIGTGPDGETDGASYAVGDGGEFAFPLRISVLPRDGDASRRFRFSATASDGEGELVVVRAEMGFAAEQALGVRLLLEGVCIDQTCDSNETCRGGECTDDIDVDDEQFPLDEDGDPTDMGSLADMGPLADGNACVDGDGDGFPALADGCEAEAYDCDDGNDSVFPGAPAACGTGIIEDCRARAFEIELVADEVRSRGRVDTDDIEAAMAPPVTADREPRLAVAYLVSEEARAAVGPLGDDPAPTTVDFPCLDALGAAFLDVGYEPNSGFFELAVASAAVPAADPWLARAGVDGETAVCRAASTETETLGVGHLFGNGGGDTIGFGMATASLEGVVGADRRDPTQDRTFPATRPDEGWVTTAAGVAIGFYGFGSGPGIAVTSSESARVTTYPTPAIVGRGALVRVGTELEFYWGNDAGRLFRQRFPCSGTNCRGAGEGSDAADLGTLLPGTPALLAGATLGDAALLAHRGTDGTFSLTRAAAALFSRPLPEIDALGTVLDLELVGQALEDGTLRYVVLALVETAADPEIHELVFRGCTEP